MAKGDYIIKQKYAVVNDAIADALGKNATPTQLDTSDLVSLGSTLESMGLLEGFFAALTNRIVKTVYFVRVYSGKARSILRDEHEYGAFVQKVYFTAPDFTENPEYKIPQSTTSQGVTTVTYNQSSPYDVSATVEVSASIFGGQGTISLEFVRPVDQIRTAFLSEAEMIKFIDGIYVVADNKVKKAEEELTNMAVNTAIAYDINAGLVRNLLTEYNTLQGAGNEITAAQAMRDADFLRYAAMEIKNTIGFMSKLSVVFNAEGYETFTDPDDMVIEMLGMFNSFSEVYLQSDTFHAELVQYPRFEEVDSWQTLSNSVKQDFETVSSINIKNGELEVEQAGVVAFIHDIEHVAAYFGHRRTWEKYNERDDVYIHGDTMRKGYAVDGHANGIVFVVADESGSNEGGGE